MSTCRLCHRPALTDRRGRCYRCRQAALAELKLTDDEKRLASQLALAAVQDMTERCRETARKAS